MRLTTLLRRLLGVTQMYVKQVEMAADGPLTVSVEPSWRRSRCGTCGKRAPRYDRQPVRQWRHLSWGRMPAWLRYAPWRVSCRRCRGVKVEQVPWASGTSVFTSGFEELAAYLAQVTDRTAVKRGSGDAEAGRAAEALDEYLDACGTRRVVLAMIKRRAAIAGLPTSTCCHTFRATRTIADPVEPVCSGGVDRAKRAAPRPPSALISSGAADLALVLAAASGRWRGRRHGPRPRGVAHVGVAAGIGAELQAVPRSSWS